MQSNRGGISRRGFISTAAAMGAGLAASRRAPAAQGFPLLPTVKFGGTEITRLIIGSNPFYGYSHFNQVLDRHMREWMTQDRKIEVLKSAEHHGINTWQLHYNDEPLSDFKRYRAEGGRMNLILLADFALMQNPALMPKVVAEMKPLGIGHHGNRTDERFRSGEKNKVREFLKVVRDSGVMVGLSTHNPQVIETVESEGWDIDYYQACLYRVTRTAEEARQEFGESPIGELYYEKDPERMCAVIRRTKKPCLAFKLLGAGRLINNKASIGKSFRFALQNIKPGDAVIVGMYPRFSDQVRENTELVRGILTEGV
jgi:hypothetical protein